METLDTTEKIGPNAVLKPAIQYAVILSMIAVLLMVITYYFNIDPNQGPMKFVNWIISIAGVFWFVWHYKTKINENQLSFGTGVKLSALTGVFAGIVTGLFLLVFMSWIAPDYHERILESAVQGMQKEGLNDAQIRESMPMVELFTGPLAVSAMVLIGTIISYTLIGLIATAIMKNDRS